MKNLIALFLAGFATLAVAGETSTTQPSPVEHYSYGTKESPNKFSNVLKYA